jgi:coenzyme F420-reducing hydrogenase delta subunit
VHCASRIDILDLLKVFECGADGAYVITCHEENCKYEKIAARVKKRVEYTKQLISEIGIESDRLCYFETGTHPEEVWRQAAEEMIEKVKTLGMS